jgi:hypothetical protein
MSFALVPLATLLLAATLLQQAGPPSRTPLRNTFVVATESVLDQAASLDLNADAAIFDPGMATLKTAEQNLQALIADDQEQAVADQLKSMMFTLSSCRIQAIDGADISKCLLQLGNRRTTILRSIHKHKESGVWTDGDPRP